MNRSPRSKRFLQTKLFLLALFPLAALAAALGLLVACESNDKPQPRPTAPQGSGTTAAPQSAPRPAPSSTSAPRPAPSSTPQGSGTTNPSAPPQGSGVR